MSGDRRQDELQRMLDEQRTDALAAERTRERSLLAQAGEETRLAGVLAAMSAQGWQVGVWTRTGRTHHGTVTTVGQDFCALSSPGATTYLPVAHLAFVRPGPGALPAPAAHPDPELTDLRFDELVRVLSEDRPAVLLGLVGSPGLLAGTLSDVGTDVVTLLLDEQPLRPAYVALASVAELSLRGSG